jgi:hypothetical protein
VFVHIDHLVVGGVKPDNKKSSSMLPLLVVLITTCVTALAAPDAAHDQTTHSVKYSRNVATARELQQQQQVTLTGEVYYDVNGNGQRDAGEGGVQINFIQIRNCDDNSFAGRASTDSNGQFTFTSSPGSYYPRFDFTRLTFPEGGVVDPATGRTECVSLDDGEEYTFSIAVTPEKEPTVSPSASPAISPSISPSVNPTLTTTPSLCLEKRNFTNNIMSSAPISVSTYGMVFSVSSPETNEALLNDPVDAEYLYITSLSLRINQQLLSSLTSSQYQVWFKQGEYNEQSNWWGNFDGWTLVSEGNASGNQTTEPLIQDTNYFSGVNATDNGLYDIVSLPRDDGGLDTLNALDEKVTTYLYQIPPSNFKTVGIAKNGGKGSFYVTLDKAALQGGEAAPDEVGSVEVENANYDSTDYQDMNLRIHIGEAVRTYPWSQTPGFYSARRFLGKVWYQQYLEIPCDEWDGMPSMSPTRIGIPPLPTEDGVPVSTTFSLSFLLQRSFDETGEMKEDVQSVFAPAILYLENVDWVFNHCIWGQNLTVLSQELSEPFRRRNLRGDIAHHHRILQADITLLKVVVSIKGYAHSDPSMCPAGVTPTTPLEGGTWKDTLASIAITYTNENGGTFVDYLKETDSYFAYLIGVTAAKVDDSSTVAGAPANNTESTFPLIPVIAAVAAVAVLLLIVCICCVLRRRKRDRENKYGDYQRDTETRQVNKFEVENIKDIGKLPMKEKQANIISRDAAGKGKSVKKGVLLKHAWPTLQEPTPNEAMFRRGLMRCNSSPDLATVLSEPLGLRRTGSIGCLRDVWVDLNRAHISARPSLQPGYGEQLLNGKLYPVGDLNSFYSEAERNFISGESDAFVPYGTDFDFIDERDALYYDDESNMVIHSRRYDTSEDGGKINKSRTGMSTKSINPLVLQQVEMLEAKWKQLKDLYEDEGDDDGIDIDKFDVESRIGLLMGRIEQMEEERQRKLARLKEEEYAEQEALKKKRMASSAGIDYNKNFGKDFVIKKKKKKKKKKKVIDELDLDDVSSESDNEGEGEFDVKWMRLKVPLAAQDPETMRDMVEKGKEM